MPRPSVTHMPADKPGPIFDFDWAPNGKEFAVVYGMMPVKGLCKPPADALLEKKRDNAI